ncbi:MAG: type I-C CRISPR-associated endonuclease Cas1c [Planctomycetaceae bacterium]|jgi:CRISPR-associated protein Cas1|nr:type I-C CRISPR-associated endonuclease Cas1c [Planctomycetaceae bacterium]
MKPLGNTLYITKQGSYVSRDGTNIVISLEGKELLRLPVHTVRGLICFGNVLITPFALGLCGENNVAVSFLTENGRFLARVSGAQTGNVLLRRAQHRFTTDTETVEAAARCFVAAKAANCRTVLMRFLRDHPPKEPEVIERAAKYLANILQELKRPQPLETLRGIEGDAAQTYFSVFDQFILTNKNDFYFRERSRRPPLDNVNALLSFFYTILAHDCTAACESVGLDPQMGFLHADRPGRPSLALDLMEEFRPWFVDRFVLTLINLGQVKGKDFTKRESGGVEMQDDVKREVLRHWQERKKEEIVHPFLGEKVPYGLLPFVQAQLLARYLRGDLDAYPPFFYR